MQFEIGHNIDVRNWKRRLEYLRPRCIEIYLVADDLTADGMAGVRDMFQQLVRHRLSSEFSEAPRPQAGASRRAVVA